MILTDSMIGDTSGVYRFIIPVPRPNSIYVSLTIRFCTLSEENCHSDDTILSFQLIWSFRS